MNQLPNSVPENREAWNQRMDAKARLREARDYINFGIKEGVFDPDMFDKMGEAELVEWAEDAMNRADASVDLEKEDWRANYPKEEQR